MKKNLTFLLFALMLLPAISFAENKPYIEVAGSADMTIIPDEIHITIRYEEYYSERYEKGIKKEDWVNIITLDTIEPQILTALENFGVKKEQITITDDYYYHWFYYTKTYLKSKKIKLVLKNFNLSDSILTHLDVRGIENAYVSFSTHSKIHEYRKQVKIAAVRAAKEKAEYMMESIGQQVGKVIYIIEGGKSSYSSRDYSSMGISNTSVSFSPTSNKNDDDGEYIENPNGYGKVEPIKLKYEIQAKFEVF